MPKKSNIPNKIISFIQRNPSASREKISKALGVSYQAVQKHLRNLEESETVRPGFIVSFSELKKKYKFFVLIETRYLQEEENINPEAQELGYQEKLCDEISRELIDNDRWAQDIVFQGTNIVFGADCDIILTLFTEDASAVSTFVIQFLRTRPSIISTSTFWSTSSLSIG